MGTAVAEAIFGSHFKNPNANTESCSKQWPLKMKAGTVSHKGTSGPSWGGGGKRA